MARPGWGAPWVRAHARSALAVAALAVEVGSFACAGAQPDGTLSEASTESTPVANSAQPDPPTHSAPW